MQIKASTYLLLLIRLPKRKKKDHILCWQEHEGKGYCRVPMVRVWTDKSFVVCDSTKLTIAQMFISWGSLNKPGLSKWRCFQPGARCGEHRSVWPGVWDSLLCVNSRNSPTLITIYIFNKFEPVPACATEHKPHHPVTARPQRRGMFTLGFGDRS